ncbi:MAG: hypothetical protein ABSA68_13895 [Xanthobacteraceae bacterium]|jgi:probable HAF family extracellular repeat protein
MRPTIFRYLLTCAQEVVFDRAATGLKIIGIVILSVLALGAAPDFAKAATVFEGLGFVPGYETDSWAYDVSANGKVVVGSSYNASTNTTEAFRWTAATGMVGIGSGIAFGVNANGSVVVGNSETSNTQPQAFRWTAATGMVGLGYLPGNGQSGASGVSANGSVVVGYSAGSSGLPLPQAYSWTAATGMTGLGYLPGASPELSGANDESRVSANGKVISGSGINAAGSVEAYRWTAATGMVGLGFLPGETDSVALGISGNGRVVVGDSENPNAEAFRWTAATGMVGLGYLPGDTRSYAYGADRNGSVIVGMSFTSFTSNGNAFIWTAEYGMESLQDLLSPYLAGWTLNNAFAVSANGDVIVGEGTNPQGQDEAWIADIAGLDLAGVVGEGVTPLPATLPLFATGLGALGLFGWRRKRKAAGALAA